MQTRLLIATSFACLASCNVNDFNKGGRQAEKMQWVSREMGDTAKPGAGVGITVPCPKGMQPISGAGSHSSFYLTEFLVERSQPVNGGWLFAVRNQTNAPVQVKVKALVLCSDQAPPPPPF